MAFISYLVSVGLWWVVCFIWDGCLNVVGVFSLIFGSFIMVRCGGCASSGSMICDISYFFIICWVASSGSRIQHCGGRSFWVTSLFALYALSCRFVMFVQLYNT